MTMLKMEGNHLADNSVYQRVEGDISQALAFKLKLKALKNAGLLNNEQFKFCMPTRQARIGRLYFLKKVHKIPYGIRPIVSSCGSVTENISEFVDYCLQGQVKKLTSYIGDSTDFIQKIKAIKCSAETLLVSLDIASLYTNIPHEDGIKAVEKAAMVMGNKSPLRPKVLAKLTEIVLRNIHYNLLEKITSRSKVQPWGQKWPQPMPTFSWES